jgi:hypothetical protein
MGNRVWIIASQTHTCLPNGWRFCPISIPMGTIFVSYPYPNRGIPHGLAGIGSPLTSLLVAWFNDRHAQAKAMQTRRQRWAPKPTTHLNNTKERANRHEVQCFDEELGKYEITTMGGTTSDGEVRPSRTHVVLLDAFLCGCGKSRQYHFPCSHYVAAARHHNFAFERRIPSEFSVESLVRTWSPPFKPFLDESQWPTYTSPIYIADPAHRWDKRGTRKRNRCNMVMDQVFGRTRRGRVSPFLVDLEQNECGKCGRLGHNSRTCIWTLSQV